MDATNILMIGLGPHAKRIYYPICKREGKAYNINLSYVVDLEEKEKDIKKYLIKKKDKSIKTYFIKTKDRTYDKLSSVVEKKLSKIIHQSKIKGVIISTEPQVHKMYAQWALKMGLSILMDKPVSIRKNASINPQVALKLEKDYQDLKSAYLKAKRKNKKISFILMAQRRWHPVFIKMRSLIREVFEKTNCPVTSIQSFHADGQWRLPSEIIDIDYHGFNHGFGKCGHSGYHFFDVLTWLIGACESTNKLINNVDIYSNLVRPHDFITQLTMTDYEKLFPEFRKVNRYSEKEFRKLTMTFGEIDAFNSFAFKHNKNVICLGSANLIHNGFSQRGWLLPKEDLYKGNGRLRQESHFIEQGPFQAISYISYQSKEINPIEARGLYNVGGEYHSEIHVFRNSKFFPNQKSYEKISIKDLNHSHMSGKSRGHQEDARRSAVIDFFKALNNESVENISDFLDHEASTKLMAGVYRSIANKFIEKNPVVNIKL